MGIWICIVNNNSLTCILKKQWDQVEFLSAKKNNNFIRYSLSLYVLYVSVTAVPSSVDASEVFVCIVLHCGRQYTGATIRGVKSAHVHWSNDRSCEVNMWCQGRSCSAHLWIVHAAHWRYALLLLLKKTSGGILASIALNGTFRTAHFFTQHGYNRFQLKMNDF